MCRQRPPSVPITTGRSAAAERPFAASARWVTRVASSSCPSQACLYASAGQRNCARRKRPRADALDRTQHHHAQEFMHSPSPETHDSRDRQSATSHIEDPNVGSERRRRVNSSRPAAPLPWSTPHRRTRSFDDLIGSQDERRGNRQADGLGRPLADHQLERCWLLDRKVTRLRALQDLVDETRSPSPNLHQVCAV